MIKYALNINLAEDKENMSVHHDQLTVLLSIITVDHNWPSLNIMNTKR